MAWPLLLIFGLGFGLIVFIISRFFSTKVITVDLPVSDGAGSLWVIGGHVEGDLLWLSGVHPNFAHALGRRYADLDDDLRPYG